MITTYKCKTHDQWDTHVKVGAGALISLAAGSLSVINHGLGASNITLVVVSASLAFKFLKDFYCSPAITIPQKEIKNGYGEFIVYSTEDACISEETYRKVYDIFNKYSFTEIAKTESELIFDTCKNRNELIQQEVEEIDPSLKVAFVPRTLYELAFIIKAIKEDKKNNNVACVKNSDTTIDFQRAINILKYNIRCKKSYGGDHSEEQAILDYYQQLEDKKHDTSNLSKLNKCWHIIKFDDDNLADNNNSDVMKVAFWLNKSISKLVTRQAQWTLCEIQTHTEEKINFLKKLSKDPLVVCQHIPSKPGLAAKFGNKRSGSPSAVEALEVGELSLDSRRSAHIIRNSVKVECSEMAQTSYLLYRGSIHKNDTLRNPATGHYWTLSYGSGLFAGCLRDTTATAFWFAKKKQMHIYPLSVDQLKKSPFFIPENNALCQLSSKGERFHPRTLVPEGIKPSNIHPNGEDHITLGHLVSEFKDKEIRDGIAEIKSKAIAL